MELPERASERGRVLFVRDSASYDKIAVPKQVVSLKQSIADRSHANVTS
jgi:hypothetical protein